jgi:NAD(P)-dependent dehydrogenase (short-subunit alcohol dehydrogenase family)
VTDHIVVGDRVALDAGFHAARTRLRMLAKGGMLLRASEVAYGEGITALVELAGPAAGLTRLADVCLEDLTETDDCAHIALQWEAIAADGKLFTALLADLMLAPAGDQITALSLAGAYCPPPGRTGAGLARAVARCCAMAAIGSFLDSVACELVHPAGTAGPAGPSPVPGHGGQP